MDSPKSLNPLGGMVKKDSGLVGRTWNPAIAAGPRSLSHQTTAGTTATGWRCWLLHDGRGPPPPSQLPHASDGTHGRGRKHSLLCALPCTPLHGLLGRRQAPHSRQWLHESGR
jgi:hypothetical protein